MTGAPAYQLRLRRVVLDRAPAEGDLQRLGGEAWRWLTYRRLVRNRLYETLDHAFPRLIERVGLETFRSVVDRFLAERASRSRYLRDVPGELLEWLERWADAVAEGAALPPYAIDLARLEWAELATAYTPAEVPAGRVTDLAMDRPAALSPAHRVLSLKYPVHRLVEGESDAPVIEQAPVVLCLYRDADPRSFEVHTLELSPVTGALLRALASAERPLADVIRSVARREGAVVDGAFLEALSAVLADLIDRGVILGSLRSEP